MVSLWEAQKSILKAGDRVTLRHEDGRCYGPVELRSLAIDPATLYVPGFDGGSIRQARSVLDWLEGGWRVVEFEPGDHLPTKPGVYRTARTAPSGSPGALYVLDADGTWCWYLRKGKLRMPGSSNLVPFDLEGEA